MIDELNKICLVFILAALCGCGHISMDKFLLPNSQNVSCDGKDRLQFEISTDRTPEQILLEINQKLATDGWTRVEQPANTSNIIAVSSFRDSSGVKKSVVYSWVQSWSNKKKEMLSYALGYAEGDEAKLGVKKMNVQVFYLPSQVHGRSDNK